MELFGKWNEVKECQRLSDKLGKLRNSREKNLVQLKETDTFERKCSKFKKIWKIEANLRKTKEKL